MLKPTKWVQIEWPTIDRRFPRLIVHDPEGALGFDEWHGLLDRFAKPHENDNA